MDEDADHEEELPAADETPKEINLTQSKRPSPFDKKTEENGNDIATSGEFPNTYISTEASTIIETPNHTTVSGSFSNNTHHPKTISPEDIAFTVEQKEEEVIVIMDDPDKKSQDIVNKHGLYDISLDLCQIPDARHFFIKRITAMKYQYKQAELEENKNRIVDLGKTLMKEVEIPLPVWLSWLVLLASHLIVATQRPLLPSNSGVDSRRFWIPGAEQLCAFVDTPEVEKIAEFVGEQKGYPEAYQLPEYSGDESTVSVGSFDPNEKDALFEDAAKIVDQVSNKDYKEKEKQANQAIKFDSLVQHLDISILLNKALEEQNITDDYQFQTYNRLLKTLQKKRKDDKDALQCYISGQVSQQKMAMCPILIKINTDKSL
ncbi:hypothetical protein FQR65_LT15322 [Abscondita terminalis]|nr:hypothetical protein FQR65_LT15322 [Abscondita terminalis]